MNKKIRNHAILIAAIVMAAFIAAAFTPARTYAKTAQSAGVTNIAKVDYENRTLKSHGTMIADNEVPLAAAPSTGDLNMTVWCILVTVSVVTSGVAIYINRKISNV